jgi:hypothetical protein
MAIPIWEIGLRGADMETYRRAQAAIDRLLNQQWCDGATISISVYDLAQRQDIHLGNVHLAALKAAYEHVGWAIEMNGTSMQFSRP